MNEKKYSAAAVVVKRETILSHRPAIEESRFVIPEEHADTVAKWLSDLGITPSRITTRLTGRA